ncbi:MAG: NAD(+)/NADH kinase [Anaerolineae bacterium]|nr:NAD(+)/NADH kinase [Anaerolineae bacterium]
MERATILYHANKAEAAPLASAVERWLAGRGVQAAIASGDDLASETVHRRIAGSDLTIVLGGDGSTLRTARVAACYDVPIFGINLGRVGFLSEAEPADWRRRLAAVVEGDYWIERRLMLNCRAYRGQTCLAEHVALNDVVVSRGSQARVLRLHLYVDNDLVTTYTADGLIVATPTGSTAYAMAAGGPLLPPQLLNLLVVPVAPHLSLDRAVILHEKAVVTIQVEMDHEASMAADGQQTFALESGDQVEVISHDDQASFVRVGNKSYFYHRLMEKLGFWHPKGLS